MDEDQILFIYGRHAVTEALRAPRRILRTVFIAPSEKEDELKEELRAASIPIRTLDRKKLPGEIDADAVHQGVIGAISTGHLVREYKKFMSTLTITPDTSFVILGEVQDPHNVGAIIRSAAAFGATAVFIPEHNQAQITASVIKVSAGMAFQVPLVSIGNVNTIARDLKEQGFWIYGLTGDGDQTIHDEVYDRPSAFIVGNEGKGMREKTREVCDILLRIPMHPRCESLNVSVSAAVVLSAWSKQHPGALNV